MRRFAISVFSTLAMLAPNVAAAQATLPKFYVYGEDDSQAEMKACKVTHAAAIGIAKTALRGTGATIQENSEDPEAVMDVYLNISAAQIGATPNCSYNLSLTFESFADVRNPFTGATEFTKLAYCNKGVLMVWNKDAAQATINDRVRDYALACLEKYKGRGRPA